MNNKDHTAKELVFYTNVKEVEKAVKIKELGALTKGLQTLRSQLIEAVMVRVDPTEKNTRPLVEYVQSCSDCSPIIDLWDYQTSTNIQSLECLVPDIVSLFIRLCNTPIIRAFGLQLVQTIMQRHMKSLYRGVASSRIPQCQSAFRVLISMASFNQTTARDLFQSFNFQAEGFSRACRYRQLKKGNSPHKYLFDLRTLYVQYVMAFIIHGDSDIKKQALGVKGLVNGIFSHIDEDAYQLIEETLTATYEHLISDYRVPRSAKLALFTPYILEKLGKIYGRQEPEATSATETGIPADLVHHFLLSICTVPGIGVCFKDAGWYPPIHDSTITTDSDKPDQVQNKSLAKFILSLKPSDDLRQQELLLKILHVCPELVQTYWKSTALTLEVRLSSKWLGNATFLQKVIKLSVPSLYFGNTQLYPATPPNAMTILDNILPSVFNRSVSSKGLQHSSALVRFTTSNILSAVFQKFSNVSQQLQHVIAVLKEVEEHDIKDTTKSTESSMDQRQATTLSPSAQWKQCLDTIREELRRRLPEIQTIIKLHSEVFGKIDTTSDDNGDNSELKAQRDILQVSVFRLLRYYQEYVPLTFMENHVDPSNLIPVDILSVSPSILVHLLELLLNLSDFRWSNKSAGKSVSHITTLLTLYLRTPYKHIRSLTARLVNQTLSDSFMFKHDPEEVDLWLQSLPQNYMSRSSGAQLTLSTEQDSVLGFLDDCFTRFGKAQYRYTDQLVELVANTITSQNELHSHQDGKIQSIYQSLVGNYIGSSNNNNNNITSNYEHPFSPLLLVLLERLRFIKSDKRPLVQFMTRLYLSLETKQKLPCYLEALLTNLAEAVGSANEMDIDTGSGEWTIQNMMEQIKTCLKQRFSDGASQLDWNQSQDSSHFVDLISNVTVDNVYEGQKKFVEELESLPVYKLGHNLESTANYCVNILEFSSFGPLVDYISSRHPLAANLFDYPDLQNMKTLENANSMLPKLLESIPFHVVFYNAWSYTGDLTLAQQLLKQKMNSMVKYPLFCALSLTLQKLSLVLINNNNTMDIDTSAIDFCFGLIHHGLHLINNSINEEQDKCDLKHLIFDNPAVSYFTGSLTTLLHQLGSNTTYPPAPDHNLVHLCVKYLDIFGEGSKAIDLLDKLMTVDFDTLHTYCNNNGHGLLYSEVIKLLISLINCVKKKATLDKNGTDHVVIPGKVFAIVAQMWSSSSSGLLDTDVLSLLELDGSTQIVKDDYRQSQRLLLNVCGELVVKRILGGEQYYSVNMADLEEACKETNVPVSSLILDSLTSTTPLPMTVSLVYLVPLGYRLLTNDSSSTDNGHAYLQTIMEHILKSLTSNADATIVSDVAISDDVYDALVQVLKELDEFDWTRLDAESVRDFVLTTLLDNISTPAAIRFTTTLVKQVYHQYTRMEPLQTYVRRIFGHDLYQTLTAPKSIDALFKIKESSADTEENVTPLQDEQRFAIIELLGTLNDIQPLILANHHGLLDALLTSYGATTLPSDRRILGMLLSSERHGDQTILPKLLMWGPGSDKTRQDHAQAGTLLQASTISVETFGLIHREMIRHTFLHMPPGLSTPTTSLATVTYDIDFFLPLFANLIASGTLDCRRFIESDGLGLTIVSLSSLDEQTRKIGYQMMDQFYVLLEHSNFKGKFPIKYLLDMLKQAIVDRSDMQAPPRLPPAVCLCVAQTLSILLLPSHHLLPYISKWLTQKPALDMNYIPMFVPLFTSTSANQKRERLWILEILASSIKTMDDYKMYSRHRVWDLTASYYNSPLADMEGKLMVLEMIQQATLVPQVTLRLIRHNGLLTWLHQLLTLPSLSGPSTSSLSLKTTTYLKSILAQIQSAVDQDDQEEDANMMDQGNAVDDNGDSDIEEEEVTTNDRKNKLPNHIKILLSKQLALLQSLV